MLLCIFVYCLQGSTENQLKLNGLPILYYNYNYNYNSITAKAMGLIFSLFDVASARQVPFGIPQYV